jgi:GcrA cell cycle regulator
MAMSWTDDRVETLKRMWSEGQSASQIAKELGGVTRNAVIGKVHRLGLSNRTPGNGAKPADATARENPRQPGAGVAAADNPGESTGDGKPAIAGGEPTPRAESAAAAPTTGRRQIVPAGQPLPPQPSAGEVSPEALASVREIEKRALRLSLMELTERTCKWPVGDPATEDFWFCGLPTQQGKPYCEAHVGLAFQPMSSRRDRRR